MSSVGFEGVGSDGRWLGLLIGFEELSTLLISEENYLVDFRR